MSSSHVIIRPYHQNDAADVSRVMHNSFTTTWRPNLSPAARDRFDLNRSIQDFVELCGPNTWVAETTRKSVVSAPKILAQDESQVVAIVLWSENFVDALHVHQDWQRVGLASKLMRVAENEMRTSGFDKVRLETDSFNTKSHYFYLRCGYVEKDRYPDLEWNSGFTTLLYEKKL